MNIKRDKRDAEILFLRKTLQFYACPGSVKSGAAWNDDYPGGIGYQEGDFSILDTGQLAAAALRRKRYPRKKT
mgnify:CR=1 FL=1